MVRVKVPVPVAVAATKLMLVSFVEIVLGEVRGAVVFVMPTLIAPTLIAPTPTAGTAARSTVWMSYRGRENFGTIKLDDYGGVFRSNGLETAREPGLDRELCPGLEGAFLCS